MTAALRELLQEARRLLDGNHGRIGVGDRIAICSAIDAALAESAPEPVVASELDTRDYWVVADTEVEYAVPDGYERETLKAGSKVWLARWTEDQLEAARRSADELHRKLHAAPHPASQEWARKLEEQAANVIAWSCRLEAEQGPQAKCLEWCRDKRRCTASFAQPPASQDAIPQGLDFARQRNMAVTDEWLRGWEGARQFAMGNDRK